MINLRVTSAAFNEGDDLRRWAGLVRTRICTFDQFMSNNGNRGDTQTNHRRLNQSSVQAVRRHQVNHHTRHCDVLRVLERIHRLSFSQAAHSWLVCLHISRLRLLLLHVFYLKESSAASRGRSFRLNSEPTVNITRWRTPSFWFRRRVDPSKQ